MIISFEDAQIDLSRRSLVRAGQPVHVEPQVFDLIVLLAQSGGVVLSKDILVEQIWAGLAVSDATINARISAARAALGDTGKAQKIIRTLPRRGFQFCPDVAERVEAAISPPEKPGDKRPEQLINYTLSRDGSAIAWTQSGQGPPLIRIGHWMSHLVQDSDSAIWGPWLDHLESKNCLVRYDLRGTGMSARDAPLEGLESFVDDLEAVAKAAGHERYNLVAVSQAAPVAVAFAARAPETIGKIVLLGGYAEGRALRPSIDDSVDEETLLALIRAGWGRPDSAFMKAMMTLFAPDASAEQRDELIAIQQATANGATASKLRSLIDRFDVSKLLHKVQAPTLVLHGIDDAIQPLSQGQKLAAGIPGARFLPVQTANHVLLSTDPAWETVIAAIDGFLAA